MPAGRPRKLSNKEVQEICALMEKYIEETKMPILAEFSYQYISDYGISKSSLYDYKEFSILVKKMMEKKETYLERNGLSGSVNPTMAIFSLKQIGWSDKKEIEHTITDVDKKKDELNGVFFGDSTED